MAQNKTGRYFKYAIGEIILVVIGILIALQINNWNETKKKRMSWKTYTESLIKDLKQDTTTLNMVTKYINDDSLSIEKISSRLSSEHATVDSLIKIARYELRINSKAYRPPNDKTFLAMQANGTIELFDNETYALLLDLQNQQAIAGSIIKVNNEGFDKQIDYITSKYGLHEFNSLKGPLIEKSWENVNEDDLFKTVQGFITAKKMMNRYTGLKYNDLLNTTEKVLTRLVEVNNELN
ncbi:DUF6090 family protein [Winogradskyella sp. A3E31]|uniref:DUF6090 family protein n=1 Tax=Winogradskyella sp. A3E31 TaxID=3349637 RepID=UPI00398AA257